MARASSPAPELDLDVVALDDEGSGWGLADLGETPIELHLPGTLPGEHVHARLDHVSVHPGAAGRPRAWGTLLQVLRPSAERVAAPCPAFGACGGCSLMHASQASQLAFKREKVRRALSRHPELAELPVDPCVPSPLALGYRNQAKYVYGRLEDAGRLVLGAYAPGTHTLIDLAGCRVVHPLIETLRTATLELLATRDVPPFDETRRTGLVRYVLVRVTASGSALVTFVVGRPWPQAPELARLLSDRCTAIAGVVLNVNPSRGNTLLGDEEHLLAGAPFVLDRIADAEVRLSSRSFFQVNRDQAARIYGDLLAAIPRGLRRAVDAYAGAGGIAMTLADRAAETVAIEENAAATQTALQHLTDLGPAAPAIRFVPPTQQTACARSITPTSSS